MASLLPHRPPVIPQLPRQHPFHPLRLRKGQRIEPGVEIGPQPHTVAPHVRIVFDAILVPLEPRLGIEPRHPYVQRRLVGIAIGIRGAELGMLERLAVQLDRKSTRLNSSHGYISYAVFCLKKKMSLTVMLDMTS